MFMSLLPLNEANIPVIITANVPTRIPPAVEPELPPMNIKTVVSKNPLSESDVLDTVEKPAVRGVMEQNSDASSF